jgi:tripartite-type tricarboxylate transporter receptor subunit TctC
MGLKQLCTLVVAAAFGLGAAAQAQFPSKPVRLVVPFPPGGTLDTIARTLAAPMSQAFGQSVIVENRAGATGVVGTEHVARAAPDGHTVLLVGPKFLIDHALQARLPYSASKDFVAVARIASSPFLISVHPSVPAKTLEELLTYARANPGRLSYATPGTGSSGHLAMELMKSLSKVDIVHVPYQGGGPATIAVLGAQTDILAGNVSEAANYVAAGKLRALAVTSLTRSDALSDVPTVAETALPGFDLSNWFGAWVRAGTPTDAVNRLSIEINRALQLPEVRESLRQNGLSVVGMEHMDFEAFLRIEATKYEKIVNDANLRIDH